MSETWLINEEPKLAPATGSETAYNVNFKSNNEEFTQIIVTWANDPDHEKDAILTYSTAIGQIKYVYNPINGGWTNNNYKTLNFTETIPNDLLAWLQANGTKQATPTTKQQIDLSKLSGWASLASGSHQITIKTKANGYADSAASNAVSVDKVASGYTVNFSNDLGESPSTTGKLEYTLDGTTWNTVLEWSNWDGDKQPLQVTSLSNVSTIKFRLTMSEGEPSTLTLTGTVAGSTTKVFEIETNFSTTTVSTDMLTLTSAINVSITNGDSAP